jgi:arabinogalactan oligomer/maltooligosaccharide transport system substrate-binding protein
LISEDELPKTWEELAKWSKEFSEKNPGKFGFVVDVENPYYTIVFASGKGNRLFGENGDDISTTYLNTPEAIEGMEIFQNLRKSCIDCPSGDLSGGVVDSLFASGSVAMHMSGPWYLEYFANAGIDYGIVPLPSMPEEPTPSASFSTVTCMFVSAYSEHPEEASAFAEFLLSEEMQLLRYKLTGSLPSISTDIKDEFAVPFMEQLKYSYPMPVNNKMVQFWDVFRSASSNIWNGSDVKTELDAAEKTITKPFM